MPPGWARIDVESASLAFRDGQDAGTALVNARCSEGLDAPLLALTNQLLAYATEREYVREETIPMDGREARHTEVRAKLDGVLMAYDIFVLKKDGCVYDFVYVTTPEQMQSRAPAFRAFVSGFHTLESGS